MAYFLPSYLQKRLLRYALARLDFLDDEALDLNNLDITIGQRSIIELKNVGIKVSKLLESVSIPSAVDIKHARIRNLRITVPADLHVSGVEVEVDGVEIEVNLDGSKQNTDTDKASANYSQAPSHKDIANRPRLASTTVHDPGGRSRQHRPSSHNEPHVLPTSADLAQSFLADEPEQRRRELEAAVESRSVHIQRSHVSLESSYQDDTETGLNPGFSLPGFVADFFTGVADRLSVLVRNIAVVLVLYDDTDTATQEPIKFMLKVDEICLSGISAVTGQDPSQSPRKTLSLTDAGLFILAGWDSQAAASSPGLFRSQVSSSPEYSRISLTRPSHAGSRSATSLSSSPSSSRIQLGLGVGGAAGNGSEYLNTGSAGHVDFPRTSSPESARTTRQNTTLSVGSGRSSNADLAESTLFSHDDAQSMYMSAMSSGDQTQQMPGGWTSSEYNNLASTIASNRQPNVAPQSSSAVRTPTGTDDAAMMTQNQPRPTSEYFNVSHIGRHLVSIETIVLHLPSRPLPKVEDPEEDHLAYGSPPRPRSRPKSSGAYSSGRRLSSSHSRVSSIQSTYGDFSIADIAVEPSKEYQVDVGEVRVSIDMAACHLIIRTAAAVTRILPTASKPPTPPEQPPDIFANFRLQSMNIAFFEHTPEFVLDANNIGQLKSARPSDEQIQAALLYLQVNHVVHKLARTAQSTNQEFTIRRFVMGKGSDQFISFFTPDISSESFVASSMVVNSDDIVLKSSNERVQVLTKHLRVSLDLLAIDEVLTRSGGLSSLLDIGSSIASAGTIKEKVQPQPQQRPRTRSVRFNAEEDQADAENESKGGALKIDARVAGALIDLVGSESTIQVKTSSIKVIYRSYGIRTQVSTISIRGPRPLKASAGDGLSIRIAGLKFDFSDKPNESDLERLMSLVTPSSDKYDSDDDIMVDTLMRQRRKGAVVRFELDEIKVTVNGLAWTRHATQIVDELARLSSVTKYLPEDDRPGVLILLLVRSFQTRAELTPAFGTVTLKADLFEAAQISVPSLVAAQISSLEVLRGRNEQILCELIPNLGEASVMGPPMLMCRFIADEMEPTIKLKISHLCFRYTVPLMIATTKLLQDLQASDEQTLEAMSSGASEVSHASSETSDFARKVRVSIMLRTSGVALHPASSPACAILLFNNAVFGYSNRKQTLTATADIRKASLLIIDDVIKVGATDNVDPKLYFDQNDHVQELTKAGYVPVGSVSAANAKVQIVEDPSGKEKSTDVEFSDAFLTLETCADSFQTLVQIMNDVAPPSAPSQSVKYRTEIVPIDDMLASFGGDAFVSEPGPELGMQVSEAALYNTDSAENAGSTDMPIAAEEDDETFLNDLYISQVEDTSADQMTESYLESVASQSFEKGSVHIAPVNITAEDDTSSEQSIMMHSLLDLRDQHFVERTSVGGTAHRWDATKNTYDLGSETAVKQSPLKVRVRNIHAIWNLFDGYDWQNTRDVISDAVQQVEERAIAKQRRRDSGRSPGPDDEDESVVGDVLFNSIYISIPTNRDPRGLADAINMELGDAFSETGSHATSTTITAAPSKRTLSSRPKPKKLRLKRSKQHKMTFELEGVSADFLMFPPGSGEVESSLDIRVKKLDIFDHVPTSTWKKFATYMHEAGEREVNTDMVHIEVLNVKPVADLAASEMVLKLTALPLRLHVDQDALDFMTRFFEFKDDRVPPPTNPSPPPFIQRAEVNPIKLRLDFKPKRVDYSAIRSGRTSEFMNFIILDRADIVLRRVILYGVSGLDRMGLMLHAIWSPDVTRNQLPTVLAGLAPIRSLVDIGSGVRDLIAVPIREYKKDGRIVRSIQKGGIAFAKTTATELVNLGAKLALGTQAVLQNTEEALAPNSSTQPTDDEDEAPKQISLYADQPLGIVAGLRGAYKSLERDLLLARDAIVAVPGEVMADPSATGAAKAVIRQGPTIILRPAIGVTKAVGQAFLGAGNTLDRGNRRRVEEKYKRY